MSYKSKTNGLIAAVVIAFILILAIVGCLIASAVMNVNVICLFKHNYNDEGICTRCGKDKPVEEPEQANSNVVIQTVMAQGMQLNAAPAPLADNPDTYTLTATITPASADDKRVEWTVAWKNAQSVWAIGKKVTDYVTVTPTSANALTATVTCVKDFGEQVIVSVTSLDNEEAKAQCTVDYVQRITGFTFNMPTVSSTTTSFTYDIEYSNYTIAAEVSFAVSDKLHYFDIAEIEFEMNLCDCLNEREILAVIYEPKLEKVGNTIVLSPNKDATARFCDGRAIDYDVWYEHYFDECEPVQGLVGCFVASRNNDDGDIIAAFREAVGYYKQGVDLEDGFYYCAPCSFDITYSTTYDGKVYSQGTQTIGVYFDGQALHVPVDSVSLSQSALVF